MQTNSGKCHPEGVYTWHDVFEFQMTVFVKWNEFSSNIGQLDPFRYKLEW